MVLVGVRGNPKTVNNHLLVKAMESTPSLVIDCANCANPHKFPFSDKLNEVYILEAEVIYAFRDIVKKLPSIIQETGAVCVVITTPNALFNYQNEKENYAIYKHSWELLKIVKTDVYISVYGEIHEELAKKYCDEVLSGTYSLEPKNSA